MIIAGLSGSLRRGSFNTALLAAAAEQAPEGVTVRQLTIADIPVYDADLEAADFPAAVTALKDAIAEADALLLVSPEYNNSIPGAFKNAIDWASRPPDDAARVFSGKPTGLIGASPGNFGTTLGQAAWLPVLRTLGCDFWTAGRLIVPQAGKAFDADGKLADEKVASRLQSYMQGFAAFVRARTSA